MVATDPAKLTEKGTQIGMALKLLSANPKLHCSEKYIRHCVQSSNAKLTPTAPKHGGNIILNY